VQVTRLRIHPVKSFAGLDVPSARVLPWGLEHDRRWAVVDTEGTPITARTVNDLLGLTATPLPGGGVRLADRDESDDSIDVDVPTGGVPIPVGHSRQGTALPAGPDADAWISMRLGSPARLVWQPDPRARIVNPTHGGEPGDHVSLADVGPLLLASEVSMRRLNEWTDAATPPLDIIRFRPNVVIDGDEPFAEDGWSSIRLGDVQFRVLGPCDRCVMTTVDPVTLVRGKEPIRTLAKHRRWDGKTWFGVWLVPMDVEHSARAMVRVGDVVEHAETAESLR
jgi:uncharacterized protein